MDDLDETDRAILHFLQTGARDITNTEIGEKVGVSTATVGERISNLKDRGVITTTCLDIDYEEAGLPHYLLLLCTVSAAERESVVERALRTTGVVTVREILAGEENLHVEIVGRSTDEIGETIRSLEETGLEIADAELLKGEHRRPFNGFGSDTTTD